MKKLLCPSMMCADVACLDHEVRRLVAAGADILHLDVMDGHFVPNFGMGLADIAFIAKHATIPCDAHLMVENPGEHVELFARTGVQIIYIHPEADTHPARTLQKISALGLRAGLAIDPDTTVERIEPLLNLTQDLLVMTVNPGFAGQAYIPFVDEKIQALVARKQRYGYRVLIDGACSLERVKTLSRRGVDGFVLGTAALFGKEASYEQLLSQLRAV